MITPEELAVLEDSKFLITKQVVSEKIIQYLSQIERALHEKILEVPFNFPEGSYTKSGKISKGEKYLNLPYFILDYPRLFSKKDIFAVRHMIWWGNNYSCTLHLAGDSLLQYQHILMKNIRLANELMFCINSDPWQHHHESDNYLLIKDLTEENIKNHIAEHGFVKISDKLAINRWEEFESFSLKTFARFLLLLK